MAESLTLEGTFGDYQVQPLTCQNTSRYSISAMIYKLIHVYVQHQMLCLST